MLDLPVLAAGTVGTCLGLVVAEFLHRAGVQPLAQVVALRQANRQRHAAELRALEATVDRDLAHLDAVQAQDAMGILAQRLSDEMRLRVAAETRLMRTEEELADVHLQLARMKSAEEAGAELPLGLEDAA